MQVCEERESSRNCEKTVTAGEAARVSSRERDVERRRGPDHGPSRHMGQEEEARAREDES